MAANESPMTNESREEQTGQYAPVYKDDEFLQAIRDRGGMASTRQVADRVGCDKDTAYRRLRSLRDDQNRLTSEDIGNTILWRVDE